MTYQNIIYSNEDSVAKIVFNRPEVLNALSEEMCDEIAKAIVDARDDAEVRVIVITGAGRAFSAGGDVKAMAAGQTAVKGRAGIQRANRLILTELTNLEKPVIAMVNGPAVGASCNIALACDVVIASEEAKFGEVFSRIGLIPDLGGLYNLPRLIGMQKAKMLVFTGNVISAEEAKRLGMVTQVVPAAELENTVMALAARFARAATKALGMAKMVMHRAQAMDLASAIELEAAAQGICFESDDHKEGVNSFLEKRTPQFKGR